MEEYQVKFVHIYYVFAKDEVEAVDKAFQIHEESGPANFDEVEVE